MFHFVTFADEVSHPSPIGPAEVTADHMSGASAQVRRSSAEYKAEVIVERVTRIELALSAWEADVLPLNYTRNLRRTQNLGYQIVEILK